MGRVHISYCIAFCCTGLLIGLFAGQYLHVQGLVLLLACALIIFSFYLRRVVYIPILIVSASVIGMWRGGYYQAELSEYNSLVGSQVKVTGIVVEDPTVDQGQTSFVVESVSHSEQIYAGSLYVTTYSEQGLTRGDAVTLEGTLVAGFGVYSAALYRATITEKIPSQDIGIKVRTWFEQKLESVVSQPESTLGMGFLTGQKSELPSNLTDALQTVGLTHVVVASGYNLTILVRLSRRLLMKISKFTSTFGSIMLVVCFIAVAGMGPSLERAAIVTLLSLAAWYYGRRFHPLVLLTLVAAVTAFVKPSFVWNDLGWTLSFLAFFGVMIVAPLIQKFFFGDEKPGMIRQILGETVAAHILTAPLLIGAFGVVSHVAIFTNLLVLPFIPVAMLFTFCSGIGALVPYIGSFFGSITDALLGYMVTVVYFFAELPWAVSELRMHWLFVAGMYTVIAIIVAVIVRITKHDMRDANIID